MLLERKSSQACMNKVYFILSNKGGGGFEGFLKKKKEGEGKKTKNGNPHFPSSTAPWLPELSHSYYWL